MENFFNTNNMFDFNTFKKKLKKATKTSFIKLKNIPDLYAFSLFSDEYCQTISVVANTYSHLQNVREDYDDLESLDCKFSPEEWDFDILNNVPEFDKLTNILRKEDEENEKSEEKFIIYRNKFYSICFDVLLELKEEGFFQKNYGKDIFLIFAASEFEFNQDKLEAMIKQLNSNVYIEEYLNWMKTWGE